MNGRDLTLGLVGALALGAVLGKRGSRAIGSSPRAKARSRFDWIPPVLYHGTTSILWSRELDGRPIPPWSAAMYEPGAKNPSPFWLCVTASREDAEQYAWETTGSVAEVWHRADARALLVSFTKDQIVELVRQGARLLPDDAVEPQLGSNPTARASLSLSGTMCITGVRVIEAFKPSLAVEDLGPVMEWGDFGPSRW